MVTGVDCSPRRLLRSLFENVAYAGVVRIAFWYAGYFNRFVRECYFSNLAAIWPFGNICYFRECLQADYHLRIGRFWLTRNILRHFRDTPLLLFWEPPWFSSQLQDSCSNAALRSKKRIYSKIIHFNKWLGVAFLCDSIAIRLNLLVLSYLRGTDEVAVFCRH